jgi:hypothetical protein
MTAAGQNKRERVASTPVFETLLSAPTDLGSFLHLLLRQIVVDVGALDAIKAPTVH